MQAKLTHLDEAGRARMVDVSDKSVTRRKAVASACIKMKPETLQAIRDKTIAKGDALAVARIAGIGGAKATSSLIPLCHNIVIDTVDLDFEFSPGRNESKILVTARAVATGRTGVEMEALTACSVAALAIYDMCKAVDRDMVIDGIRLESKEGGRSGDWKRD